MSMNVEVHINEEVFQKIMHWIKKAGSYEVSGLGNVVYDAETQVFTVTEAYLLEQENTGTETDISDKAIGKLMFEHHKDKVEGELRFWWHSHAQMEVFWSQTDLDTIKQLAQGGWFLNTVFNAKEEMLSSFYVTTPIVSFSDELDTFVMGEVEDKNFEKIFAKMGLKFKNTDSLDKIRWQLEKVVPEATLKEWDAEYEKKVSKRIFKVPAASHGMPGIWGGLMSQVGFGGIDDDDDDRPIYTPGGIDAFPDYVPKPRFTSVDEMDEEELEELLEDIRETCEAYPEITKKELIEMFEAEYPFVAKLLPKKLGKRA